jgi:hypothetical protein
MSLPTADDILAQIRQQMVAAPRIVPPASPVPTKFLSVVERDDETKIDGYLRSGIGNEVEVSFGSFSDTGSFFPGLLSIRQFMSVMEALSAAAEHDRNPPIESETTVLIMQIKDEAPIRKIGDLYQKKNRAPGGVVNKMWGYRITSSVETHLQKLDKKFQPSIERRRQRTTFLLNSYPGFRFDLTVVDEKNLLNNKMYRKYEIEIERTEKMSDAAGLGIFMNAIKFVLVSMQDVRELEDVVTMETRKDIATTLHRILKIEKVTKPYALVEDEPRQFKRGRYQNPYMLPRGFWNKPSNLTMDNMLEPFFDEYSVTTKLDGERRFLLFTDRGAFFFSPPGDVWKTDIVFANFLSITLIDGEFYYDPLEQTFTYYMFDILFLNGADVRTDPFLRRIFKLQNLTITSTMFGLVFKQFLVPQEKPLVPETVYDRIRKVLQVIEDSGRDDKYDGIILQPLRNYYNDRTRKWKNPSKLSIDFVAIKLSSSEYSLHTVSKTGSLDIFKGDKRHPYTKTLQYDGDDIHGRVIECVWSRDEKNFRMLRFRQDRDKPNGTMVALDVWRDIHDPIEVETLKGDDMSVLRRLSNREKRTMLTQNLERGQSIMDWGSGRGGDLDKWSKLDLKEVYIVEPSEKNLKVLEQRAREMGRDAPHYNIIRNASGELVGAEATDAIAAFLKTAPQPISAITSFFSLTYLAKDRETFLNMIDTIDKTLPEGGMLVGIVMDGERTKRLLIPEQEMDVGKFPEPKKQLTRVIEGRQKMPTRTKKLPAEEKTFAKYENDVFSIKQTSTFKGEFGDEIVVNINDEKSMVKNQTEWLLYFDTLVDFLKQKGIVLRMTGFYDRGAAFKVLPKTSQIFSSLNRYFIFQKKSAEQKTKKEAKKKEKEKKVDNKIINPYTENLRYASNVGATSTSSFIEAVLYALHPEYRDKNIEKLAEEMRELLASGLTKGAFAALNGGVLARGMANMIAKKQRTTPEQSLEIAHRQFVEYLRDTENYLGPSSIAEILSKHNGVNILLMRQGGAIEKVYKGQCLHIMNRNTIFVFTTDNIFYHPAYLEHCDERQYIFSEGGLVHAVAQKVCPLEYQKYLLVMGSPTQKVGPTIPPKKDEPAHLKKDTSSPKKDTPPKKSPKKLSSKSPQPILIEEQEDVPFEPSIVTKKKSKKSIKTKSKK